jgi:oxygen-dependent protoporphyrinogen oxidase
MADPPQSPRVAVVGGGIAGLAAAHRLVELSRESGRAIQLTLHERSRRLGGTISTERSGGFVIEGGPDSFLTEKPEVLRLCERLGATGRLVGTREELRRTYVALGNRLHPLPEGFLLLAPTRLWPFVTSGLFSWQGKLRMGLELLLPRGGETADESLASFVTRRFGREALERVAQPLVGGIYTADPERLSLTATMPRFAAMERAERSLILAMWRQQRRTAAAATSGARWSLFASFDDGMQTLVDLLAQRLPEGVVRLGSALESLRAAEGGWWLDGDGPYDSIVVATPAHVSARILTGLDSALAAELAAIPYASSATITLAYRREDIPHPLDGFGFVVPAVEGRSLLACTFSSLKYASRAPTGFVMLRGFAGGVLQPQALSGDDSALVAAMRKDLAELMGIRADPVLTRVCRHPQSMPQYEVGHQARVARIRDALGRFPGLWVVGGAYEGVGIPDCVRGGESAAAAVFDFLRDR